MAKGIFTTKVNPLYDDLPEIRYHFPKTYLNQAQATIGDWIVYYEPRRQSADVRSRGGRQGYFATARVQRIEADSYRRAHYYAFVTDFLEFEHIALFRHGGTYLEDALMKTDGSTNKGAFGRSVRLLSDAAYQRILQLGFTTSMGGQIADVNEGIAEEPETYQRPIVEPVRFRLFRDVAFTHGVRALYKNTCAMTGLSMVNGGGRPEVEAAHIRPVGNDHHGPDSMRNGIALSRSIHWMFDRGLISLTDDYNILIVESLVPDPMKRLLNPDGKILLPADSRLYPHPQFLHYHREHIFKG
ncbi:MAG: HNH endonuclease [Candidatus Tectimicrobiota bacterium]